MARSLFTVDQGTQEGIDALNGYFDKTIGHKHDGSDFGGALIGNVPSGGITSLTIQGAINELDTKKMPRTLVGEVIVSAATSQISFTGLDGNLHGGYELVSEIVNTTGLASNYTVVFNLDNVLAHYFTQYMLTCGATISSSNAIPSIIAYLASGESMFGTANISRCLGGMTMFTASNIRTTGNSEYIGGFKTGSETNLTSISIGSSVASGIGINSRFRLYRRM